MMFFADPSDKRYIGCYVETVDLNYALQWWVTAKLPQNTNGQCIEACKANGFKYAGNVSIFKYDYKTAENIAI